MLRSDDDLGLTVAGALGGASVVSWSPLSDVDVESDSLVVGAVVAGVSVAGDSVTLLLSDAALPMTVFEGGSVVVVPSRVVMRELTPGESVRVDSLASVRASTQPNQLVNLRGQFTKNLARISLFLPAAMASAKAATSSNLRAEPML